MNAPTKGRVGEYLFAAEASDRGFLIGFPAVEAIPFDFFLDNGKRTYKVQVKSTHLKECSDRGCYYVTTRKAGGSVYTKEDCDFIVCLIKDLSLFYVIPVEMVRSGAVRLYPGTDRGLYEEYREAWHLFEK